MLSNVYKKCFLNPNRTYIPINIFYLDLSLFNACSEKEVTGKVMVENNNKQSEISQM